VFVDSVSRYADVLGPEGIDRFRELGEKRWATVRPAGPGDRDHERWGANYRITRVMERLAELSGDVDAVVAVKSRDLSMPYDWLEVAEVYAEAGRPGEALDWAGRGVAAFPDHHDPRLDEFLWMRLAVVREGEHPDDAVPIFQREIERLIDTKNNRGYADAVALMDHVHELLVQAGRAEAFAPYAERVRAAHKPKRNLMKLFDAKGW